MFRNKPVGIESTKTEWMELDGKQKEHSPAQVGASERAQESSVHQSTEGLPVREVGPADVVPLREPGALWL